MVNINRYFAQKRYLTLLWLIIPLVLSAFTHMWNPIGFPALHVDEGHYMRRAMQVIQGLGPQESNATYDYGYDHPYFGQIFLAAALSLVNYPNSINPTVTPESIEMLYLIPRILMGVLAVIDTFLVYMIADTRYNRKVAFVSATLFAVMPLSGLLRGIFLDSIALPFILLSILFAIYYAKSSSRVDDETPHANREVIKLRYILLLSSGIFLGLAIFTKLPTFPLIPLMIFLLLNKNISNSNSKKSSKWTRPNIKALGLWFIPVLLIPMIWPGYAISMGEFGNWVDGVIYQTARDNGGKDLRSSFVLVFGLDPVLLTLAAAATIWAVIKRDYLILLWTLPYIVFLYLIGWAVPIHWSILVPVLCVSSAVLIDNLINAAVSRKLAIVRYYPHVIISAVIIIGLVSTTILIESNLNSLYFQLYFFLAQELQQHKNTSIDNQNPNYDDGTTIIGSHRTRALIWIPLYVFKDDILFRETDIPKDNFTKPLQTNKFLIVADSNLLSRLTGTDQYERDRRIAQLYYNNSDTIATFIDKNLDKNKLMNVNQNYGFSWFVDVRANY